MVFMNSSVSDLIWRRMLKISLLNFQNNPENSLLWSGKIIRPLKAILDYELMQLKDHGKEQAAADATVYAVNDARREIAPEESMSGIMDSMGISVALKAINKAALNTNTPMLEDYSRKTRVWEYRIEDFYFKDNKNKLNVLQDDGSGGNRVDVKQIVGDEVNKLNLVEE